MTLTPLAAVLIFVGIPAAFILLMALIILAPGWTRVGSYRPGEPWPYEPLMISGSGTTDVDDSLAITPVAELGEDEPAELVFSVGVGGASARW